MAFWLFKEKFAKCNFHSVHMIKQKYLYGENILISSTMNYVSINPSLSVEAFWSVDTQLLQRQLKTAGKNDNL